MKALQPPADAPQQVLVKVFGPLQLTDSFLRLYGHPLLLRVAAEVHGRDFVPFSESIIVKQPLLGPAIAWHQDGTKLWDHRDWDENTHGFNFMAQLDPTDGGNALWVVPGTHRLGKLDIAAVVERNGGSERLDDAVPLVCGPGDVAIVNRQLLHGSFPNSSRNRRVTLIFGFHRRASVLEVHDTDRIHRRSCIIPLAIDWRRQRYPAEPPYEYQPLAELAGELRWSEETRSTLLQGYNAFNLSV